MSSASTDPSVLPPSATAISTSPRYSCSRSSCAWKRPFSLRTGIQRRYGCALGDRISAV